MQTTFSVVTLSGSIMYIETIQDWTRHELEVLFKYRYNTLFDSKDDHMRIDLNLE